MSCKSNKSQFPTLSLTGSAYQRGCQHGNALKDLIRPRVQRMWSQCGGSNQSLSRKINETVKLLNNFCSDIVQEIKGIGDGAGIGFEEIFLYNNRDIWKVLEGDSCSIVLLRSENTVAVGMNKDAPVEQLDMYIFQQSFPDNGCASCGYGHVGRVWGHGINEHGLCTAGTAVMGTNNITQQASIGNYLLPRIILSSCTTLPQALELIRKTPTISGGANFMIADQAGDAAIIEMAPKQQNIRQITGNSIVAANHFLSGKISCGPGKEQLEESVLRANLLQSMLKSPLENENDALTRIQTILGSHGDKVSVCRHNVFGFSTALSWVALLKKRQFFLCNAPPCKGAFNLMN